MKEQQQQGAPSAQHTGVVQAGRELDTLVAEKVMGWTVNRGERHWRTVNRPDGQICVGATCSCLSWNPSTSIADAWQVVEKMVERGYRVRVEERRSGAYCDVVALDSGTNSARENTAPLAICKAALQAVADVRGTEAP